MPAARLKRHIQDLTVCFTYNFSCLQPQHRTQKDFRSQYRLCEEIQRGGFGIVYRATRIRDGRPVAVKYVQHKHVREWLMHDNQLIPAEVCHLARCANISGVVELVDYFATKRGFLIVMERPEACLDLFDLVTKYERLDEDIARWFFVQIVDAVLDMKNVHSLVHRDIKDENVIVDMETGEVKLVDFGATDFIDSATKKQFQGTRSYCPPEWFKHKHYLPLEATAYSLGVVLYILVVGRVPFRNEIQTCLGRLQFPLDTISESCKNLIRRCLCVTPTRRITLAEIRAHEWMREPAIDCAGSFRALLRSRALERGRWTSASTRVCGSGGGGSSGGGPRALRRRDSARAISDAEASDDGEPELCLRARYADGGDGALVVPAAALAAAAAAAASAPSSQPPPHQTRSEASTRMSPQAASIPKLNGDNNEPHKPRLTSSPLPARRRHPRLRDIARSRQPSVTTSFDVFRSVASSTASTYYELPSGVQWPSTTTTFDDAASLSQSSCFYSARQSFDLESGDLHASSHVTQRRPAPLVSEELYHSTISHQSARPSIDNGRSGREQTPRESFASFVPPLIDDLDPPYMPTVDVDRQSTSRRASIASSSDHVTPVGNELAPATPTAIQRAALPRLSLGSVSTTTMHDTSTTPPDEPRRGVRRWFSDLRRARSLRVALGAKHRATAKKAEDATPTSSSGGSMPTVRRLAWHSSETLVALGPAIGVQQNEGAPRLRAQANAIAQVHPSIPTIPTPRRSATPRPKRRSLLDPSVTPLSVCTAKNAQPSPPPPSRRRRRPVSTIPAATTVAKTCASNCTPVGSLQYETLRYPLAVFDVCSHQYPL